MPKVLCTLPNASDEISGVRFVEHAKGKLSEEISDAQAAEFASIPGYSVVGAAPVTPIVNSDQDDARAALLARAEAVGLKVKGNWGAERLATEVDAAEAAAVASQPTTE